MNSRLNWTVKLPMAAALALALVACGGGSDHDPASEKPAVAQPYHNNAPNRIVSTLKSNPDTTRAFNWFTSDAAANPVVLVSENKDLSNAREFAAKATQVTNLFLERDGEGYIVYRKTSKAGSKEDVTYFVDKDRTGDWEPVDEATAEGDSITLDLSEVKETVYAADASGLKPATTYYYRVGAKGGQLSDVGTFKTAGTQSDPFTFIHYTDTQNAYWNEHKRNEAQFGADTLLQAQKLAPHAEFVLHTGDIVEVAGVEDEWLDLMEQSQKGLLAMSLAPVTGNHDEYGLREVSGAYSVGSYNANFPTRFNEHFNVDSAGTIDGGSYYSYTYNNAHFVVLNTNDNKNSENKALGKQQLDWLRTDVQNARANGAEWIIVNYHKPLFSKSYHSLQDADVQNVRDEFMRAIDELDVDVALQGHDHVFSRTKSLRYAPASDSFVNAQIDEANFRLEADDSKTLLSPAGTTFLIPNTGGTKAYDAIFDRPLEEIHKLRPRLNWITQSQLDFYKSLFEIGFQPSKSPYFANSHSNRRESSEQNFAIYHVDGKTFSGEVYQISGDLAKGEARTVKLVDKLMIDKN